MDDIPLPEDIPFPGDAVSRNGNIPIEEVCNIKLPDEIKMKGNEQVEEETTNCIPAECRGAENEHSFSQHRDMSNSSAGDVSVPGNCSIN